jgi:hypothetical protein
MSELSPSTIRSLGHEARGDYANRIGHCRDISRDLQTLVSTRFDIQLDVVETHVGEQRDTHFVNKLAAEHYTDCKSGTILIDATIDQFCTENQHHDDIRVDFGPKQHLPAVAIYPPGAEERHVWYYRPNNPHEGQDVFTVRCVPSTKP